MANKKRNYHIKESKDGNLWVSMESEMVEVIRKIEGVMRVVLLQGEYLVFVSKLYDSGEVAAEIASVIDEFSQ